MEASKAEEIATSPDELQDLQDDQLIHQQTEPEPEPELEDELTNDIERDPPKQPRARQVMVVAMSDKMEAMSDKMKLDKMTMKSCTKSLTLTSNHSLTTSSVWS